MRRSTPQLPVSPKLLKHFAAATVVITLCFAMFVSGEDASLSAQMQAREAKNQLLETEAETLGTRKVAMGMKIKAKPVSWGGGGDEGSGDSGGGGTGSIDPDAPRQNRAFAPGSGYTPAHPVLPRNMPMTPGQTVSVKGQLATDLAGPIGDAARAKQKGKAGTMFRPNAEQIETLKAASGDRTGTGASDDF